MQPLPIDPLLADIVASLAACPRLVLEAPPGAGKTTRVPRALLDALPPEAGEIVVLEPRRLATRMAARRVADELGEALGGTIGYRVRFEDVSSARTRVRFVTEGVLTRQLVSNPKLAGIGCVILDEFHERHVHGDVALAMLRRLSQTSRPDLRLVVMSATLDAEPVAAFLDAPRLRAEGKRFDVAIEYLPAPDERPLASLVASAVRALLVDALDGDVLVFLPGAAEIRRAMEACEKLGASHDLLLLPLHGDLSPAEQDRAVKRADRRKVIFATNVAESSVTIDGVAAVVDSGLARFAAHAPWSGISTLRVDRVSRASATQRAGRAGRTRAGRCLRLYTKADFETRLEHDVPEIRRVDLTQTILELASAGVGDLTWFEAPAAEAIRASRELLVRLGALDDAGRVTSTGTRMLRFAVHPRQARLLVEAEARGVVDDACVVAALLGERDIRASSKTRFDGGQRSNSGATERSDLLTMLDLFHEAEGDRFSAHSLRAIGLDVGTTLAVERARTQLRRGCAPTRTAATPGPKSDDALLQCVLAGYPDRVARRVRMGARALALAGGGSAELSEMSAVRDAPWMIAVEAEDRRGAVLVRTASAIEPEWLLDLYADAIVETTDVRWNATAQKVEATSRMTYAGLVLDESQALGSDAEVTRVLAEAAIAAGAHTFAAEDALARWLARARFTADTTKSFAPPTDDAVRDGLRAMCEGRRSFAELRQASLIDALKGELGHVHGAQIERFAPERVTLPGGRAARIEYATGKPPWVEAHLQDFFGTLQTPRIADGRVPLVVHLLAPNKRAVQVTTDLAGFWERHYPAVRKELMRKYPRHSWPEDPKTALPILRVPRR